jgi:hypothetical protein
VVGQDLRVSERRPEAETRLSRCTSPASRGPARSWWPATSTIRGPDPASIRQALRARQLRRHPAGSLGERVLRAQKGQLHGAVADQPGLFQAAHGGTLFLDEVAELPIPMQVKLLRAIQEKCVRPIGAQQEVPVDVRILSHPQGPRNPGHRRPLPPGPVLPHQRYRAARPSAPGTARGHPGSRGHGPPGLTQHGRTAVLSDRAQEALLAYPFFRARARARERPGARADPMRRRGH